jgi:hypothetical protein
MWVSAGGDEGKKCVSLDEQPSTKFETLESCKENCNFGSRVFWNRHRGKREQQVISDVEP